MLAGEYASSLWAFSLDFYALDGVSARLIEWQDRDDLDVNIVLCLCWHAGRGFNLNVSALNAMVAAVEPWRVQVIGPVRAARRAIRTEALLGAMPDAEALRKQLLQLELGLERSVQQRLQMFSDSLAKPGAVAIDAPAGERFAHTLSMYAQARKARLPEAEQLQLAGRLQAFVDGGTHASRSEERSRR